MQWAAKELRIHSTFYDIFHHFVLWEVAVLLSPLPGNLANVIERMVMQSLLLTLEDYLFGRKSVRYEALFRRKRAQRLEGKNPTVNTMDTFIYLLYAPHYPPSILYSY